MEGRGDIKTFHCLESVTEVLIFVEICWDLGLLKYFFL